MQTPYLEHTKENVLLVRDLITRGTRGDNSVLQTQQEYRGVIGYRSCLLSTALDQDVPVAIRVSAAIELKNCIDSYFMRRHDTDKVEEEKSRREHERQALKAGLLQGIMAERINKLADFLALNIALVADREFVHGLQYWPELLQMITDTLTQAGPTAMQGYIAAASAVLAGQPTDQQLGLSPASLAVKRITEVLVEVLRKTKDKPRTKEAAKTIALGVLASLYPVWTEVMKGLIHLLGALPDRAKATNVQAATAAAQSGSNRIPLLPNDPLLEVLESLVDLARPLSIVMYHIVVSAAKEVCEAPQADDLFLKIVSIIAHVEEALEQSIPEGRSTKELRISLDKIRSSGIGLVTDAHKLAPLEFRRYIAAFMQLFTKVIRSRAEERRTQSQKILLKELGRRAEQKGGVEAGAGNDSGGADDEAEEEDSEIESSTSAVMAMNFISNVLTCKAYSVSYHAALAQSEKDLQNVPQIGFLFGKMGQLSGSGQKKSSQEIIAMAQEVKSLVDAVVTEEWAGDLLERVVVGYLPWSGEMRTRWRVEAEDTFWEHHDAHSGVDEHAAATSLLLALTEARPAFVSSKVLGWFGQLVGAENQAGGCTVGLSRFGENLDENGQRLPLERAPLTPEHANTQLQLDALLHAIAQLMPELVKGSIDLSGFVEYICTRCAQVMNIIAPEALTLITAPIATSVVFRAVALSYSIVSHIPVTTPTIFEHAAEPSPTILKMIDLLVRCFAAADGMIQLQCLTSLQHMLDSSRNEHVSAVLAMYIGDNGPIPGTGMLRSQIESTMLALEGKVDEQTQAQAVLEAQANAAAEAAGKMTYGHALVDHLLRLLFNMGTLRTKGEAVRCIKDVVSYMGSHASGMVPLLISAIQRLWTLDDERMRRVIQGRVIELVEHLVAALGPKSQHLHGTVLIILNFSTSDHEEAEFSDGLTLWQEVMKYAIVPTDPLLQCFANWLAYYREHQDAFSLGAGIFESYLLFDHPSFLTMYRDRIAVVLPSLMMRLDEQDMGYMGQLLHEFAHTHPTEFFTSLRPCTAFMLQHIRANALYGDTEDQAVLPTPVITTFLLTLSSLLIRDTTSAIEGLASIRAEEGVDDRLSIPPASSDSSTLLVVLDMIVARIDSFSTTLKAKEACMALTACMKFMDTPSRIGDALSICSGIVAREESELQSDDYISPLKDITNTPDDAKTEDYRVQARARSNPVFMGTLRQWVIAKIGECVAAHGDGWLPAVLATQDPKALAPLGLTQTQ